LLADDEIWLIVIGITLLLDSCCLKSEYYEGGQTHLNFFYVEAADEERFSVGFVIQWIFSFFKVDDWCQRRRWFFYVLALNLVY
jgi:hypothetical protein